MNVIFPTAAIEITGSVSQYVRVVGSGNQVPLRFCALCGTQLFSDSTGHPNLTVVRVGTLDEPSAIQPQSNIWSASAPAWACLDAALDRFEHAPASPPATTA